MSQSSAAFASVKLPSALVAQAREAAQPMRRSVAGQVEYWATLGTHRWSTVAVLRRSPNRHRQLRPPLAARALPTRTPDNTLLGTTSWSRTRTGSAGFLAVRAFCVPPV